MPNKDGTGSFGRESGAGKRMGRKEGNRFGAGPGGFCSCPSCGKRVLHQAGTPCYAMNCPTCGVRMIRG